jgi:hypothetical protein
MRLRLRGQEDRKASRRRREMLIRTASKRHREVLEIGSGYIAVREPSPYDSSIVNDDAEGKPSAGLSVVAFVICSISGAIVAASITWAALSAVPACH